MPNLAPMSLKQRVYIPPCIAAGDVEVQGFEAPFDGTVTGVNYVSVTAITGADTQSRTIQVFNRTTGAGTAKVAELALVSGVNTVAATPKTITLTATAADLVVAANDNLSAKSLHVGGTGLVDPGGVVEVEFTRT